MNVRYVTQKGMSSFNCTTKRNLLFSYFNGGFKGKFIASISMQESKKKSSFIGLKNFL